MRGKCILVLGGARGGKSHFAQELAKQISKKVLFVATAEPLDEEMDARIKEHRMSRPETWRTLEASLNVGEQIREQIDDADVVIIDCLTLLISNILTKGDKKDLASDQTNYTSMNERVATEIEEIIQCINNNEATFIVVSNEVGMGLVPPNKLGRDYRDLLGRANQLLAKKADNVYLMVAGIPWPLKGKG